MEKELFSIVLTLAKFCSMLFGADLHVCTDHKNLTYKILINSQVLHWCLFLEYHTHYHYFEGKANILVDAFSCQPTKHPLLMEGASVTDSLFFSLTDDAELLDSFINFPPDNQMRNPLDMAWIQENQFNDHQLNLW